MKLKKIIKESESRRDVTIEEKRKFVNSLKQYSKLGERVYGADMSEVLEEMRQIVETADSIVLSEIDGFDAVTENRMLKRLKEDYKIFEASCSEMKQLQERLSTTYENIGRMLERYFEVR
jgi:G3E family GTPase